MKQMVNPTILTHIWKNSCTAGSNQLLAYFFCWICNIFASLFLPRLMECYFEWITQILLNGPHKYFEWSTQILLNGPHKYFACPHNIPFPQEKPNNTAGHCRETYFGTKYKYLYWLGRSNNIGLANKELLLQFMFAKCNAIPEEIQIQDNWKHK